MRKTKPGQLAFILLFSLFAVQSTIADDSIQGDSLAPPEKPILVGVNYFAGWWKPLPNKWVVIDGKDWREDYPGRVPLLGQYNEQETLDREIVVASRYGVDFFLILWYFNGIDHQAERGEHTRFLNVAVEQFMESPNADRMHFAIEYCNHEPFQIKDQADWDWAVKTWVEAMKHPSYLRVGGKPLFKVHSWHHYWFENGENLDQCLARMEQFRQAARDAGLGELLVGGGIGSYQQIPIAEGRIAKLFDFTSTYMELPLDLPPREDNAYHPYETLAEYMRGSRQVHGEDALPYLPYFGLNFNAEPWGDQRSRFEFPTREQLKREFQLLKADLENTKLNLGVPPGDGTLRKIFTIYAWNEYGEGGFLAPTVEEQTMKLEVLEEVFGSGNASQCHQRNNAAQ
ncbi:MAG: hypothetical protein FWD31_14165 [Planctomycetaceae bacterium]|nr:hypothetical protein [Planctomycetaceae bacterium]